MLRIYYNQGCSKSRAALGRLEQAGLAPAIVDYLADPPQREQLTALIEKLDVPAARLLRQQPANGATDNDAVIDALLTSPELLQRPVIEDDTRAIIARPVERVDVFLSYN